MSPAKKTGAQPCLRDNEFALDRSLGTASIARKLQPGRAFNAYCALELSGAPDPCPLWVIRVGFVMSDLGPVCP
jgi:hypothetical protein